MAVVVVKWSSGELGWLIVWELLGSIPATTNLFNENLHRKIVLGKSK